MKLMAVRQEIGLVPSKEVDQANISISGTINSLVIIEVTDKTVIHTTLVKTDTLTVNREHSLEPRSLAVCVKLQEDQQLDISYQAVLTFHRKTRSLCQEPEKFQCILKRIHKILNGMII